MAPELTLRAGRRRVRISNPGKVLFPADGITKEDLARYYATIAPAMVPHVKDRPVNLWRWNRGIDEELVVQQAIPKGAPEWVRRVTVPRRRGGDVEHAVGGEAATRSPSAASSPRARAWSGSPPRSSATIPSACGRSCASRSASARK